MKFATKSRSETVTSREQLVELIDSAMREWMKFFVGDGSTRSLQLAAYSDEGALRELHRGKKWEGWISPPMVGDDAIRQMFIDYYQRGDLPDDWLNGEPEWREVAGLHPAVHVILGVVMIGAVICFGVIK
jgi:hypothetical protein